MPCVSFEHKCIRGEDSGVFPKNAKIQVCLSENWAPLNSQDNGDFPIKIAIWKLNYTRSDTTQKHIFG